MVMTGAKLVVAVVLDEIVVIAVIGVLLVRAVRNGDRQLHGMVVWRAGGMLDAIQYAGR